MNHLTVAIINDLHIDDLLAYARQEAKGAIYA